MSIPAELVDRARHVDILAAAQRFGQLKRDGAKEYCGPCPRCGGTDRFSLNTRKQLWNCRGCGRGGDVISLLMHATDATFAEAVASLPGESVEPKRQHPPKPAVIPPKRVGDEEARNLKSATRIVGELVPLKGTPGERYLADVRRIDTTAIIDVLESVDAVGWHPSVYFHEPEHPERGDPPHPLHGQRLGCIVAIMTDPVSAAPTGAISRTYLAPDLTKIGKAKTLGAPAGIVRLDLDEDVLGGLHLAEGLETALDAMARGFRPMWSAGSTSIMAKFPLLAGIEALTLFSDHDKNGAGQRAASEAAERWLAAGRETHVYQREIPGDLNDAFREARR
jgi:hypothetical protein